jgi:hypothetical protein
MHMYNKKNIIITLLILGFVFLLGFFYFLLISNQKVTDVKTTIPTSNPLVKKDNSEIEIKPSKEIFKNMKVNNFVNSAFPDANFNGTNKAIIYSSNEQEVLNTLKITNTKFEINASTKSILNELINLIKSKESIESAKIASFPNIFKDSEQSGGYNKKFISEVKLNNNNQFDSLRSFLSKDGQDSVGTPVLNLVGIRNNDVFLYEQKLIDNDYTNKSQEIFTACSKLSEAEIISCIEDKIKTFYNKNLTAEVLQTKAEKMIKDIQ